MVIGIFGKKTCRHWASSWEFDSCYETSPFGPFGRRKVGHTFNNRRWEEKKCNKPYGIEFLNMLELIGISLKRKRRRLPCMVIQLVSMTRYGKERNSSTIEIALKPCTPISKCPMWTQLDMLRLSTYFRVLWFHWVHARGPNYLSIWAPLCGVMGAFSIENKLVSIDSKKMGTTLDVCQGPLDFRGHGSWYMCKLKRPLGVFGL